MSLADQIDPAKPSVRVVPGVAAAGNKVAVGGVVQPAIWVNSARADPGDDVQVLFLDYPTAQSVAVILGRTGVPGSFKGTIVAAPTGTETVTVNTEAGDFEATFLASYTPAISDRVRLQWDGTEATVLGKVGFIPKPAPSGEETGTRPPPAPKQGDTDSFTASDSATWSGSLYKWNTYYGRDVYQGNAGPWGGSSTNAGAWFYHDKPSALGEKTVERIRFYLPARVKAGDYKSSGVVHFFLHTSKRRPGGDVVRDWSTDITVRAGWSGDWVDLPAGWGQKIIDGYGVGIAGDPYMGFRGVPHPANSGQFKIDWRA